MIKIYCDICGKEISADEEGSRFIVLEKTFSFIKHQRQTDLKPKEYLFCSDCTRAIRDFIKKRGEELKKT